jgi:hypothetical protein
MGCLFSKPPPADPFTDMRPAAEPKKYSWDVRREEAAAAGGGDPPGIVRDLAAGARRVITPGTLAGQQLAIESCGAAAIFVLDHTDSVTMDLCEGTCVLLGPCTGSLFVRDCKNCIVVASCGQMRIRDVRDTVFLLHVGTRPVLETSSNVTFACFDTGDWAAPAPGLGALLAAAGRSPFENYWSVPHDFDEATGKGRGAYRLSDLSRQSAVELFRAKQVEMPTAAECGAAGGSGSGKGSGGGKDSNDSGADGASRDASSDAEESEPAATTTTGLKSSSPPTQSPTSAAAAAAVPAQSPSSVSPANPCPDGTDPAEAAYTLDVVPLTVSDAIGSDRSREAVLVLFAPANHPRASPPKSAFAAAWALCRAVRRDKSNAASRGIVIAGTRLVRTDAGRARSITAAAAAAAAAQTAQAASAKSSGSDAQPGTAALSSGHLACVQLAGTGCVALANRVVEQGLGFDGPLLLGGSGAAGSGGARAVQIPLNSDAAWAFRERVFVEWNDME